MLTETKPSLPVALKSSTPATISGHNLAAQQGVLQEQRHAACLVDNARLNTQLLYQRVGIRHAEAQRADDLTLGNKHQHLALALGQYFYFQYLAQVADCLAISLNLVCQRAQRGDGVQRRLDIGSQVLRCGVVGKGRLVDRDIDGVVFSGGRHTASGLIVCTVNDQVEGSTGRQLAIGRHVHSHGGHFLAAAQAKYICCRIDAACLASHGHAHGLAGQGNFLQASARHVQLQLFLASHVDQGKAGSLAQLAVVHHGQLAIGQS